MATRRILVPIDLVKNELQNAVMQNLSSAPGSPVEGLMYFDTTLHAFGIYQNSAWTYHADKAFLLARANQTGTQLASTISDFDTQVRTSRLDQMAAPTADVSMNTHKITNVTDPSGAQDAATKAYVDNAVAGLAWKDRVRAATTAAGTLASSFENGDVIDGVTLATGDRILIKNQAAGAENGFYTVNASGAPTRTTDADTGAELESSAAFVSEGTTNGATSWVLTTTGTITVGSTSLTFAQFGAGSSYIAGNGLTLTGSTFDVGAGTGILSNANDVAIDTAVVVRKFAQDVGDNSSTSITVTHNLGTKDVTVTLFDNTTPFAEVVCDINHATTNTITLIFATAPATNKYRCVVHG